MFSEIIRICKRCKLEIVPPNNKFEWHDSCYEISANKLRESFNNTIKSIKTDEEIRDEMYKRNFPSIVDSNNKSYLYELNRDIIKAQILEEHLEYEQIKAYSKSLWEKE